MNWAISIVVVRCIRIAETGVRFPYGPPRLGPATLTLAGSSPFRLRHSHCGDREFESPQVHNGCPAALFSLRDLCLSGYDIRPSAGHSTLRDEPSGSDSKSSGQGKPQQIIVTVLAESSGEGSNVAAPIAKKILEELKKRGEPEWLYNAIERHAWKYNGMDREPQNNLEWSIYCCDELTGLIVAVTLIRPEKKLSVVTVENVLSKWKKLDFAKGVNRDQIGLCEEKLGIKLNDFIQIILTSMQGISSELGL